MTKLYSMIKISGTSAVVLLIAVVTAFSMTVPGAHAISMSGILKDNSGAGLQRLTKKEEAEYIRNNNIRNNYCVKVTTKNQRKFDREDDGYLNGEELRDYLEKYDKAD